MTRMADAGFTLVETLVSLAILSMTAVAMLGAVQAHVARVSGLEVRAAALWAAENHLAELALGLVPDVPPPMLGIQFQMSAEMSPTSDPGLLRVDIAATDSADGRSYPALTGFVLVDRP